MDKLLDVNNLCYSYIKKPLCLKDVSFSATKNDRVLIFGIKDSGKSTLIKVLSGFDDKYFGSVKLNGTEIKTIPDEEKNVSLVLDYPTLIGGSIDKNLNFLYETLKLEIPADGEKQELLKKFGLDFELKTNVKRLSNFEKFKLCLLRTFIKSPKAIFIDDILKNNFSEKELEELGNILNLACDGRLAFLCVGQESLKKGKSFFDEFKATKVLYLNLAKVNLYETIDEFLNNPYDLDACSFNDNFCQMEGYCVKQDGVYYLSFDEVYVLKIDKKYNGDFDKLGLGNYENEDVVMVYDKDFVLDLSKNSDFNLHLAKGDVKIFSKLDRSRVI